MNINPLATTPHRIALAGDWHADIDDAIAAIETAREAGCEAVIQLGDFGIWPGARGRYFLDAVEESLDEYEMWCAFIDGNHEDFWQLHQLPLDEHGLRPVRTNLWHLPRGTRWQWAGRTWLAMGGATSLDAHRRTLGVDWWPEEAITAAQLDAAAQGGSADVMLTHDCPAGVDIPNLSHDWAPTALRAANNHRALLRLLAEAVRPQEIWHGHFHTRYRSVVDFAGTRCVVNGLDQGSNLRASLTIIDLETP